MRLLYWTAFWVFLLDQATKYLVVHAMELRVLGRIDVLPPYLNLRMAWNYGINFGLMAGDSPVTRWVLIAVALVISCAVFCCVHPDPPGGWQKLATRLLVGGAIGTVIARLIYGAVAD